MNKTTEKCKGPFKEFLAHILPWKICWLFSLFLYKLESCFTFYFNIAVGMSRERPADTYMWATCLASMERWGTLIKSLEISHI